MKDNTTQGLCEIVARIDQILGEAQTAYTHEFDALIHENCSDPERIEHPPRRPARFLLRSRTAPPLQTTLSLLFRHKSGGHG
jgi:hypothetical protein